MGNFSKYSVYEFDGFRLDAEHLLLYNEDRPIQLTPKAVEILLALVKRNGEVISKDELMQAVWPETAVEESNLAQYLHLLRKKLGKNASGGSFIETLKRRGYRFNGVVKETVNEATQRNNGDSAVVAFADRSYAASIPPHRSLHVERRGNVIALAEWSDVSPESEEVIGEAVVPTAEPDIGKKSRRTRVYFVAAVVSVLVLGTVSASFIWRNSASNIPPQKQDLTFVNLTSGQDVNAATISPDGNYFVYASYDAGLTRLWLQQTGQPNAVEVIPPFQGLVLGTTFTPDSKFIYLVVSKDSITSPSLYRVPTLGGTRSQILKDVADAVSFSPDGLEVVFRRLDPKASRSSLVVASSDGAHERTLLTLTGDEAIGSPAWSPDGKTIAYASYKSTKRYGGSTIVGIRPETGEKILLSTEEWDNCFRLLWTRDGQGLIFTGTKGGDAHSTRRDQIYFVSVADGASRRLTTDSTSRHDGISLGVTDADDILVVPFDRFSQVWAMDANGDSRTAVQITTGFADGRSGIAPLEDGRVAYMTRHGDGFSIWLINADGSGRQQLTTEPSDIEELRSASDGRFFVFSGPRDGWPHILRVDAGGGDLTQLTFGENNEVDSTVSPDGNWIVYNSWAFEGNYGKTALWKISSSGGEPSLLSREECVTPHYSPDQRFISCVQEYTRRIAIISMDDGSVLNTFHPESGAALNVGSRWTPDGTALAYIARPKNASNIWLQPIDGSPARPLTDFKSGEIYNFAYAAKGDRLYLARGYSSRNATLIRNFK